jgi:hypothetical protein
MAALVPHLPGPDDDPVDVQEGLHNSVETFLGTVRRILPRLDNWELRVPSDPVGRMGSHDHSLLRRCQRPRPRRRAARRRSHRDHRRR